MVLQFEGTCHPPPGPTRNHVADFNAAEISVAQLQNRPVLVEHEGHERGRVLSNWQGPSGELRIMAKVDCPEAERQLRNGSLSELSLGTSLFAMDGDMVHKSVNEVSLVEKGARDNCLIDTINGRRVRTMHRASKSSGSDTVGACIIRLKPFANSHNEAFACIATTRSERVAKAHTKHTCRPLRPITLLPPSRTQALHLSSKSDSTRRQRRRPS